MTLACASSYEFSFIESVVWSMALVLPIMTFLALPKLLPLRRELVWTRIKALLPLAWLASRGEGVSWRARLRDSWLAEVHAAHPAATRRGEVARDRSLLLRARSLGWLVGGLTLAAGLSTAVASLAAGGPDGALFAVSMTLATLVMAWIARSAAAGASLWVQAVAVGRPAMVRIGAGLLVGVGYGTVAAFSAAFAGLVVLVSTLSLLSWSGPSGHETMVILTVGGVGLAILGAVVGAILMVPLALAARRSSASS